MAHHSSLSKEVRLETENSLKEGKLSPTTEVHHIKFVEDGGGNEPSNLLALCHSHHEWIHKNFKSGEIKKG